MSSPLRILIVDDDADYLRLAAIAYEAAGQECTTSVTAQAALEELANKTFDIILLDIEMPETTGLEFLFQLREAGDEIPIIVVSGRTAVESRVEGLRLGADDYICKPVNFDEVLARVEAVLRSRKILPTLTFGDLAVDCAKRKVSRAGNNIDLSPREYDFLSALLQAGGDSVSREALLRDVWGLSFDPETNVIDVHVGRVRKKLDRFGPSMIETVRGEGYRLIKPEPAE